MYRAWKKEQARAGLTESGIHWNEFIPHIPGAKQIDFLALEILEAYFGGAAGGGKSDALLMAALQYVDHPKYAALLLRRTYKDLSLPGALMDRAGAWLRNTAAKWSAETKTWKFPSGATLTFGHLDNEGDKYNYQSSEFQFVGFDEVTQFTKTQYEYLFSRLRRLKGSDVPVRMRSASNPDGEYVEWVKQTFIPDEYINQSGEDKFGKIWWKGSRAFVPSRLEDNAHIDQAEYDGALGKLDVVMYARLRSGDWTAAPQGNLIKRDKAQYIPALPEGVKEQVRANDLALTIKQTVKDDPDFTAELGAAKHNDFLYLVNPELYRAEIPEITTRLMAYKLEHPYVRMGMGKALHEKAVAQNLMAAGFPIEAYREKGDVVERMAAFINLWDTGRVIMVGTEKRWEAFLNQLCSIPQGHDDAGAVAAGVTIMLGFMPTQTPRAEKQPAPYAFVDRM